MTVQEKYLKLTVYAQTQGVQNLKVDVKDNVLYISGTASSSVKDALWKLYEEIDPEMRSGDLVLNIEVIGGEDETYEVKAGDNLSKIAAKYPGMTWQKIFEANKDILKNPDLIHPGQKLKIPK